ncbi:MAG: type 4b pilus protein PilO2 [Alphaproteobacteria bacterium]|nr:type 4b pilus protein PilO2 [Alphaproteobacteria bacterium]
MADNNYEEKAWKSSFTEGGTTYAASIFWQPLLNEDKPLPEIKEAAENILEGADLYVTRKGKSSQFGLAASSQGFSQGMPSAAIALITSLGNITSFLGVFKVDTGWWYVCFRNDVILSDGDTLFVNEKDAKNQFISMLAVPDWDAVFAPESWNIDDTRSVELRTLLQKGLAVKLAKISGNNDNIMLAVIIACFAIILWFAYSTLKDMFFSAPSEPVVAPIPIIQQPILAPEAKPWEKLPNPVDIMNNCYEATRKVTQIVTPGWYLEGVTCKAKTGLVTSWKREIGRLSWIEQALDVSGVPFSSRVLSPDGNTIMVTLPIPESSVLNSPPEYNQTDLINTINDINQALGVSILLTPGTKTSGRGTKYNFMSFSVSSTHDPRVWIKLLMKFSGLSVKVITYDVNSGMWTYKGDIYEL